MAEHPPETADQAPPEATAPPPDAAPTFSIEDVDPHAPKTVTAPPWPEDPADWIKRGLAYRWFDYTLYRFETICVVLGLALMAMISFTTTMHENLSGHGHLSVTVGALLLAFLGGYGAPISKGKPIPLRMGFGLISVGTLSAYAWLVATQSTHVAYFSLIVVSVTCAAASAALTRGDDDAANTKRRERWQLTAALALGSLPVGYFISTLPSSYSDCAKHAGLLLFWVGFLGASMTAYQRAHLQIDFVRKKLSGRALRLYNGVSLLLTITFTLLFLTLTYIYIFGEKGNFHEATPEGELPDWSKVLAIAFSMAVMLMRFTAHAIEDFIKAARGEGEDDATGNTLDNTATAGGQNA